jgi:putative membrane protein
MVDSKNNKNHIKSLTEEECVAETSLFKTCSEVCLKRPKPLKKYLGFIYWNIFLRGMIMGLSELIPGISGGTIALATGIYDRLLHNINQINFKFIKAFFRLDLIYIYNALSWKFLFSLLFGMLSSLLVFCRIITFCLAKSSLHFLLYSIIFGLVLGTIIHLLQQIKKWSISSVLFFVSGFGISFLITFFGGCNDTNVSCQSPDLPLLFFDPLLIISGTIAIAMALLPGISGCFVLLLFGQYYKVIEAVASITTGFGFAPFFVFINLFFGMFLGAFFFSKAITFLLDKYTFFTISFLSGLMIGSIHIICPYNSSCFNHNLFSFVFCFSLILVIFAILLVLYVKKKSYK